jgi:invasion protein IalB
MRQFLTLAATGAALTIGLGLSGGASMAGGAAPPTRVASKAADGGLTRKVIGDWVVSCAPAAQGHKSCFMSQTLSSEKLQKPISIFTIGRDREGHLKGSLRVPVGVSLPDGVAVGVENADAFNVPYSACHRVGCFAPFDLTDELVDQMKKAGKITAVAQTVSKQALNLNFSTNGFPSAYETYLKETK